MVDRMITLYEHDEREFKTNGLGSLNDAVSCYVVEQLNGEFELTMEYPVTGRHFSDLIFRRLIFTKPNPYDNPQPFRIYNISTPINGIVTVSAHHVSYDLDGYPLAPFSSESLLDTFEKMNRQMTELWNSDKPPFHFSTTKSGETGSYDLIAPCSARALLGGSEGTILDRWPGEYQWDIWNVIYHQNRGADRGVTIEYGKNLTDLEQEENCENCWTALYPYYYMEPQTDEEGNTTGGLVELKEKIIPFPGTYNYSRTYILDLTTEFEEMPSEEELRERAQKYIEDNELDSPKVSLTVSFLPLNEVTTYSKLKILEEVRLGDTVHVYFPRLNVASTSVCISTKYDALSGKYTEIQLGEAKSDLASTLVKQRDDTEKQIEGALKSNNNFLENTIRKQTQMITGNAGGYIVLHDTNGDGMPDELLVLDHEDLKEAKNVWRWNLAGLGHSSTGYSGEYTTGWTMDGHFNASLITVGELLANLIKVGILSDRNGYNFWNMETGEFRISAAATIDGQTIPSIAEEKANTALAGAKTYTDDSVNDFVQAVYGPKVEDLQKQIDGQIETYYYDYEPTIQNEPASLWDDDEKARHEGDLFYWKSKGYAYRFFKEGETWKWQLVQDTDVTKALAAAANAQHTADGKSRTFAITEPTPPYDKGDQWYRGPENSTLICVNSRESGDFSMSDWEKLDNYADGKEAIYSVQAQYYLSSSPVLLADGEWSNTQPEWTQGKYIWSRQYVTYGDGHYAYTPTEEGVCITGNTGADGATGAKGDPGRGVENTSITYQKGSSGTEVPGSQWESAIPAVNPGEYLWTKIVYTYTDGTTDTAYSVGMMGQTGLQGLQGPQGEQGVPGPKGDTGSQGTQGINLVIDSSTAAVNSNWMSTGWAGSFTQYSSGERTYRLLALNGWRTARYNLGIDNAGKTFTMSFDACLVGSETTATTSSELYLANAEDGTFMSKGLTANIPEKDTWKHYVETFTLNKTGYVGLTSSAKPEGQSLKTTWLIKNLKIERGSVSDPVWTPAPQDLVGPQGEKGDMGPQGQQGETGAQGPAGPAGQTSYFHIKYSSNPNPTVADEMTETPSEYIGTYVDFIEADSDDPGRYKWSRFQGLQGEQGTQGIPGINGINGQTSYLHIKYSNDGGVSFTENFGEVTGDYIGQLVDFTEADSLNPQEYTWSKIKGDMGPQGATGEQGTQGINLLLGSDISISAEPQIFTNINRSCNPAVDISTLSGKLITLSVDIELENAIGYRIGTEIYFKFEDGTIRYYGAWVFLSTEPQSIKTRVTSHFLIPDKKVVGCNDGAIYIQRVTGDVARVGRPKLEIGIVDTPVWTPAPQDLVGPQGEKGDTGNGVEQVVTEYCLSMSDTEVIGGNWGPEVPAIVEGTYLWVRSKIIYTDGSIAYAGAYCVSKAMVESVQPELDTLSSSLTDTMTQFVLTKEQALLTSMSEYTTTDDFNTFITTITSQLQVLSNNITLQFDKVTSAQQAGDEQLQREYDQLSKYFRFSSYGLEIGDATSPLILRLTNNRIAFLYNGQEVAYITDRMLYIADAHVLDSLRIGSFSWVPRRNGNLSLVKVE